MALNYIYPGSGTVPATAAQASFAQRQVLTTDLLTTDTTLAVVHNWGYDTTALALLCPHVIINPQGGAAGQLAIAARQTNEVDLALTVSAAGTFEIILDRPHSIIMPNQ